MDLKGIDMINIPPIPQQVSDNGSEIFDWALSVGNAVAKLKRINELKKAINKPSGCYYGTDLYLNHQTPNWL
jgi:hypothetical protein